MTRVKLGLSLGVLMALVVASGASQAADCPEVLFTASPIDVRDIESIRPLGNLNPPGHTFPTGHIYLYMRRDSSGTPLEVPFYAPGVMMVVSISASQHVKAGFTDFSLELQPCSDIAVTFGHVSTLDPEIFGDTSAFSGWDLSNEYETGGETYRLWRKETAIPVHAGQVLGTTGGRYGQFALDFGVYDARRPAEAVANPERWTWSRVLYSVCPFNYYAEGPLLDGLLRLLEREPQYGGSDRCGVVFQDVPGTAKGAWFAEGILKTYPEDPHLALVASNVRPSRSVFSVGTSVPGLASGRYEFVPLHSGNRNRAFDEVAADGTIYGYQVDGYAGVIILRLLDSETLWIEALPRGSADPTTWVFSNNKAVFER